ncbi:DMT family transporter [Pseudoxanthomonas sp. 10H]|uniref:DMT family transporter n=1 Tax=Pseudoxanthomonas sp. 10H TaxID=3242729 RepID=UPI003556EF70
MSTGGREVPAGRPAGEGTVTHGDAATEMAAAALDPEAAALDDSDGRHAPASAVAPAPVLADHGEAGLAPATGPTTSVAAPVADAARDAALARRRLTGIAFAAVGAILFSGKAIIVKLGYRYGADAVTLLALRMLVAFPLFLLMGWWAARRAPRPLTRGERWRIVGLGVLGYYLASFLDFAGLAYISATLERLILYLTPTLVLLIGWAAFGRRPRRAQWLALGVSYFGVALAFGHDLQAGGDGILVGAALVFGSALSYALYLVGSGELVARVGAVRLTAYASSVASVLCIGQFLLLRPLSALALPREVYWLSLVNGTLCTVAPVLLVMLGIARLGSGPASQIGMLGPVSTIVLSMLVLDEPMGPWQVAGTLLVLGGVLLVSRAPAKAA